MISDNVAELQKLFRIGLPNPITLRAVRKGSPTINRTYLAGQFPVVDERWGAFAADADALNAQGYNIYTCLNPIRHDFVGGAVADGDIACRRLLLVDLDRAGGTSSPATDEEIKKAAEVADRIETWMLDQEGERAIKMLSGNGIHLYYELRDLPNDRMSRDACNALLSSLARRFDTPEVKVDTVVFNASRITKVAGSKAYKGEATNDRPHRRAVFL